MAATVGLLLALSASVSCSGRNGTATVEYHPDYPFYETLEALYEQADLVVAARVERSEGVRDLSSDADSPIVYSVFRIVIAEVHKGGVRAGQAIDVKQLGGELDGTTYVAEDTAFLDPGGTYVLFLV